MYAEPNPQLVVVGSCNLDLQLQIAKAPQPGETVTAQAYTRAPGGKGANQAAAAARLGGRVSLLAAVGRDDAGTLLTGTLRRAGVDTSRVLEVEEPTGTAIVLLARDGQNSIIVAPGANHALTPGDIRAHAAHLAEAAMVLTQLETRLDVLSELGALGARLMLDPAPAAALEPALLARLQWFTPNAHEAAFYLSTSAEQVERDPQGAAQRLQQLGPRNVLLKLGAMGAGVCTAGHPWLFTQAPQVRVVDTTGAGDVLNAALALALTQHEPAAQALRYAVAAASLSVTRRGALPSAPTDAEVRDFLRDWPA